MLNRWIAFRAKGQVAFESGEQPMTLPADHALIRTHLTVVSPGTELALLHETVLPRPHLQSQPRRYPAFPGYAAVGEVIESSNPALCRPGERICAATGHREYALVNLAHAQTWCRVPAGMSDETACVSALVRIALSAPAAMPARYGHRVLVIGLGAVGYLAAQWYRLSCALAVHACDMDAARVKFAADRGLTAFPADELDARAAAEPYDIVVEATGAPPVVETAFRAVREGGGVVLLGTGRGKLQEFDITNAIHRNLVTVVGAHVNRHEREVVVGPPPPTGDPLALALAYLASGRLPVDGLVGRRFHPRDAAQAYAALAQRAYFTVGFDWNHLDGPPDRRDDAAGQTRESRL